MLEQIPKSILAQTNSDIEEGELSVEEREILILNKFNISTLKHNFECFKTTSDTREAINVMKNVAQGKSDRQFLMLYGGTGCGKTHLIEAAIIQWAKDGIFGRYYTFSDIARHLKGGLGTPGLYGQRFKAMVDQRILIIDDYGMGTTESKFEISQIEDIIDIRYRKRYYPGTKHITIMASNEDIKALPPRVVSRFYDPEYGSVLFMGKVDYRRRRIK